MQKWGENIFKPTTVNDSLHQNSNDNGGRTVNFAASKNLAVKSMMYLHWDIHKYTWNSPYGKTHNQIDLILIDRRWHLNIQDVLNFRGADCDTDHYMLVAKVGESLVVSKQATQKFVGERFNLGKPNELEVRKQYQIEISNRFVALENLCDSKHINRAWENIKENI